MTTSKLIEELRNQLPIRSPIEQWYADKHAELLFFGHTSYDEEEMKKVIVAEFEYRGSTP